MTDWLTKNLNKFILGDCESVLKECPSNIVDLIVTSPPYADSRKKTYGGIHPNKYVDWFLPRAYEFLRVIKPSGSFVLNIKEKVVSGERHTYVIELILALKKQGWLWTEEYLWHKKNSYPGWYPNRFRDGWERCLHFTKEKKFAMYQNSVKIPRGDWAKSRLEKIDETTGKRVKKTLEDLQDYDKIRSNSELKSGMDRKIANWLDRDLVFPDNVLYLATECGNKGHPATFPIQLPLWFIKLFTKEGDLVLDPFSGSGTTALAATNLNRNFIGIDNYADYIALASDNLNKQKDRNGNGPNNKN